MTEPIFTDLTEIAKKTPFTKEQWDIIVHRLVEAHDPLRIYLHGSYVWGTPDRNSDIRAVCGVAFFHNNMLMCFEVSTVCENYKDSEGTIGDEQAIGIAESLLGELLPTLTMK